MSASNPWFDRLPPSDPTLPPDQVVDVSPTMSGPTVGPSLPASEPGSGKHKDPKARPAVQQRLAHWCEDDNLAGLRAAAIDKLPEAEREPWRNFWADVDDLLKRTQAKQTISPATPQA